MARVLVVDDEPLIRFDLAEFLRERQYEVDEARDGKTAIALIDIKSFDAVISDYRMPGSVNGVDVLNYYNLRYPGKVKVLITAYGTDETQKQVEAVGGVFFRKPFMRGELLRALNSTRSPGRAT
jgi:DNA-binding NtrC family response regulator